MLVRARAQYHEVRLDLRHAWLRGRERTALRRLGEAVAASAAAAGQPGVQLLKAEIETELTRLEALKGESRASVDADRADMLAVAAWVRPVVALRGICVRLVLHQRRVAGRRALGPRYQALGELAAAQAEFWYPLEREVTMVRAERARVIAERERLIAPFVGTAFPAWGSRLRAEAIGMGRAVVHQLRSHLLPKAPALAGLAVGWWIANTYTDSHLRSVLRSVGIGSGGTRVVGSSTYAAMSFWLRLLAAALCAYAGEKVRTFYRRGREGVSGEGTA